MLLGNYRRRGLGVFINGHSDPSAPAATEPAFELLAKTVLVVDVPSPEGIDMKIQPTDPIRAFFRWVAKVRCGN